MTDIPASDHPRLRAERLGRAVRIPTVTMDPGAAAAGHPSFPEFLRFERLLRDEFPRAAAELAWEKLGDLALLATWRGESQAEPGLLLYAHYDVVPPGDASLWSRNPFSGEVSDGFVWGRGTLDDKCALMGIMEAVESLLQERFRPGTTVYLAFGGDEELEGHRGAEVIARELFMRGTRLSCVLDEGSIVSDGILSFFPSPLALIGVAEKGFANVEITVRGRTGHSSMPGKGTAAGALSAVLAALENRPFPARLTGTTKGFFRSLAPHVRGGRGLALRLLKPLWPLLKGVLSKDAATDSLLRTTQAVTILRAGERMNVLPLEARAVLNLRLLPGDSSRYVLERIRGIAQRHLKPGFTLEVRFPDAAGVSEAVPETRPDPGLSRALEDSVRETFPGAVISPFLVTATTDSRKFVSLARCIIRFLPVVLTAGDVAGIHGTDERISVENYERAVRFYRGFVRRVSGGA
jgi:carboxypeptidase PM20D1